jgi:DNA-binding GntR family transcriptional regulator
MRRLLILQKIAPGDRLREADLAERLGVNRSALREAFSRLHAEGFIEQAETRGYYVPKLTQQEIIDTLKVRLILECGAIDEICERDLNQEEHLRPMALACDQFELLAEQGYVLGVDEADRQFHEALIDAAGNYRLSQVYQRAPLPIGLSEITDHDEWEKSLQQTLEEHRGVLAALLEGNVGEAKRLLRVHLFVRSQRM